jgi:energy-converting hydrogenase Eha subunit F
MKKIISVSVLLFCFALISAQNKDQIKKQVTPQNKSQIKKQVTPQNKGQIKNPVTPQNKGQIKNPVTPQNKGQINNPVTPCKWQKNEGDPFTGVTSKTTNWEIVGYNTSMNTSINNGVIGDYKFAISEDIQKKDTSYMLWIRTSTSQNLCFNKDSKILIKSGETILTINLLGGILCGKNITSYGILDTGTRKFLRRHSIDLIRIQFSGDGNTIINVDLKDVDRYAKLESGYFINTFRCFE